MSVYRGRDRLTYRYDFWYRGERQRGSTYQTNPGDAAQYEARLKARLRREAGGLLKPSDTPRFQEWAGVYRTYVIHDQELAAPQHVEDTLRVVLRFWGARPGPTSTQKIEADAPYYDLRLADPIEDPDWITAFEAWVQARGVSAQTRNHYLSILRRMYRVALLPKFKKRSGIALNPFLGIPKKKTHPRSVTLDVDQIRAWLSHASYHVGLAVAIGALAPKLRIKNILTLKWSDWNRQKTFLTVQRHKTAEKTRRPLVAAVSAQLRAILEDARRRSPDSLYVVTYRGRPVKSIRAGVKAALEAASIPYGRDTADGATFHTLRHAMSTLLAELDASEAKRQALAGHNSPVTTAKYTHLRPVGEQATAEALSAAVPLQDLVLQLRRRAKRAGGKTGGPPPKSLRNVVDFRGESSQAEKRRGREVATVSGENSA